MNTIDCPACTRDGIIVLDTCDVCGSARWVTVRSDGRLINPVTGKAVAL